MISISKKPVISIIMPVYNRASLVAESLYSICSQTFSSWECIIVDDSSTDNSLDVLKSFEEKEKRIKVYSRPSSMKKGANSCRNYGLEMASGDYIHWFDSDDIAHPQYLEISLSLINENKVDFCRFTRSTFKGDFSYKFKDEVISKINEVNHNQMEQILKNELSFNTCNVIWKRTSLGQERFSEEIIYGDEWEFYPRLLAKGLKGISISNILFFGRKHENSTTFEFWNNDPGRRSSKIKAVKLVIHTLKKSRMLTPSLVKYFIQTGFFLKDYSIVHYVLNLSDAQPYIKLKYKLGYMFYPFIRPFLRLKGVMNKLGKGR